MVVVAALILAVVIPVIALHNDLRAAAFNGLLAAVGEECPIAVFVVTDIIGVACSFKGGFDFSRSCCVDIPVAAVCERYLNLPSSTRT